MTRNTAPYMLVVAAMVFCTVNPHSANAQAGSLDPTFGTDGVVTQNVGVFPQTATLDAAGDIIIAGTNGVNQPGEITRFLVNGQFDTSFGNGGVVTTSTPLQLNAVTVQADGKILVGGYTNVLSEQLELAVARFNADGTVDATFGTDGLAVTQVSADGGQANVVLEQTDGKVLAGGNGIEEAVVRYNSDGSLDDSFGSGGIASLPGIEVFDMALQSDGTILVNTSSFGVQELSASGTVEGKVKIRTLIAVAHDGGGTFQNNGEIVVDEEIDEGRRPARTKAEVKRFLTNGNPDPSFSVPQFYFQTQPESDYDQSILEGIAIQSNGEIVMGGDSSITAGAVFALARFNANGTFDRTFGNHGEVLTKILDDSSISVLLTQASGKIVAIGSASKATTGYLALARYLTQ